MLQESHLYWYPLSPQRGGDVVARENALEEELELLAHLMGSGLHVPYQSWLLKTQEPSAEHSALSQMLRNPLPHSPQEAQRSELEEELEDARRLMTSHWQVPPPPPAVQICPGGQAPVQALVERLPPHGLGEEEEEEEGSTSMDAVLLTLDWLPPLDLLLPPLDALLLLEIELLKRKPQFVFARFKHAAPAAASVAYGPNGTISNTLEYSHPGLMYSQTPWLPSLAETQQ